MMDNMDHFPKAIKKAVRYIKQDAPVEQLQEIKRILERTIERRILQVK
jgi:hypothetical protein